MSTHPQYLMLMPREDGDAVVRLDRERRVAAWDGRAEEIFGWPAGEMLGATFDRLITDRQRAAGSFGDVLDRALARGSAERYEIEHRTHADLTILLRGVASPVRDADGAFDGWLLVMYRAVADLCLDCRLLHYLEAVTADSADAIVILDDDDRIQSWNRGATDIFGFRPEEILGRSVAVLIPPERVASGEQAWLRAAVHERGFIRNYETTRLTRDGRTIRVEITRSAIYDARGRTIGCSSIVRDITERKRLEERLLQSERLAVVGRMAAQMAHEIRNPLGSISLNAELLADELAALPPDRIGEARTLATTIAGEVERLSAVIEEYLQFARLPALDPAPTDLALVVADLVRFAELELARAGVTVCVAGTPVPEIAADGKQIRQALLNLVRNAIEAMGGGGGTVTIATRADETGDAVEIAVADTGPGIPPEIAGKIFEPFFSTKDGGTGLGLAFARHVAREHGGEIAYHSAPGGGATFVLRLPCRREPSGTRARAADP